MGKKDQVLVFRGDKELRERVRAHIERLKAHAPTLRVSEADAVRDLVLQGLAQAEGASKRKRR